MFWAKLKTYNLDINGKPVAKVVVKIFAFTAKLKAEITLNDLSQHELLSEASVEVFDQEIKRFVGAHLYANQVALNGEVESSVFQQFKKCFRQSGKLSLHGFITLAFDDDMGLPNSLTFWGTIGFDFKHATYNPEINKVLIANHIQTGELPIECSAYLLHEYEINQVRTIGDKLKLTMSRPDVNWTVELYIFENLFHFEILNEGAGATITSAEDCELSISF